MSVVYQCDVIGCCNTVKDVCELRTVNLQVTEVVTHEEEDACSVANPVPPSVEYEHVCNDCIQKLNNWTEGGLG